MSYRNETATFLGRYLICESLAGDIPSRANLPAVRLRELVTTSGSYALAETCAAYHWGYRWAQVSWSGGHHHITSVHRVVRELTDREIDALFRADEEARLEICSRLADGGELAA